MTTSMTLPTPTANAAQVKAMTPDINEPPRKKHGEIRIPITAIKNRAKAPPEASRKRKMEMDQGFVEAEFQIGEHPLGLVVDWSMALPVVSGVLPGTHASMLEELRPGLVLLAINDIPLVLGVGRYEVERILTLRPLSLLFEAPTKDLFDLRIPIAWQRSRRAAFYDITQGETGPVDHLSPNSKEKKPATANTWSLKNDAHSPGDKAMASTSMSSVSFARMDFFEEHPERSPLSRFGDLNIMNANPFSSEARYRMARTLPTFGQGGSSSMPQLRQITATPASATDSTSKKDIREGPSWGFWLRSGSRAKSEKPRSGKTTKATRGWQGADTDLYYKQLLDEEKVNLYGAGNPHLWSLGHEVEYECHFGDMILCSKVREAYEVGFRGKKRDKPTDMEKLLGGTGDAARVRRIAKVEQVSCDNCGLHLADADKPGGRFFYYCRQCKRSGRRFELCVACHVLEILQGEGKHSGVGFHPHYLKCKHRSLIRRQSLENAYPSSPHLHRVLCDLCGSVIVGRGASDKSSKEQGKSTKAQELKGNLNQKTYIVSNEFYACPTCPEITGLRFELCVPCQKNISESGHGIQRLESTL